MRAHLLVLPLVMSVALAAEARAECAAPHAAIFPLGDAVPPDATLYRFAPRYEADRPLRITDAAGKPVAFTATDVSMAGAGVTVSRLEVRNRGGFTVYEGDHAARTFQVRPAAAALPALSVEEVRWIEEAWTCSHTEGLAVSFRSDGVVAVRARWSDGFEAMVPPADRAFFFTGAMGGEIDPQALRVLLGHPNCVADVIPAAYIGRYDVALTAIHSDGREQVIPLPRAKGPAPVAEPPPAPAPEPYVCGYATRHRVVAAAPSSRAWPWWIAGAGAVGALVTVALVLLVRRRRVIAVP